MNNKKWKYCSPDKDDLYQASCIPAAPRADENPTPAPKWGLDEGFAAISAASRRAEQVQKLPQVNTVPMEVWEAIAQANGGTIDLEDIPDCKNILRGQQLHLEATDPATIKWITRGEPITLRKDYQMPKQPANKHELKETRQSSNEVGLDLILIDDVVHVSTTEEIDQLNANLEGRVIYIFPPSDEDVYCDGFPYDGRTYYQTKATLIQEHMGGDPTTPMTLDDMACMEGWCRYMMEELKDKIEYDAEDSEFGPEDSFGPKDHCKYLAEYLAYAWGVLAAHKAPLQDFPTEEHEENPHTN